MNVILFETSGISKKQKTVQTVLATVLSLCGIALMFLSKAKNSGAKVTSGSHSFIVGGGKVFDTETQTLLLIIGIVSLLFGISVYRMAKKADKSYIKIYDNHVEAYQHLLLNLKYNINTELSSIKEVAFLPPATPLTTERLKIVANEDGKTIPYIITVVNSREATDVLSTLINK